MKRIALYGGSFDPPHLGHIVTVKNLLNSGEVEEVWLVPTGDDRYDKPPVASSKHRLRMLELVLEHTLRDLPVRIETIQLEEKLKPGSQTINLIEHLKEKYPANEFKFVVGADKIGELPSWVEFERLKEMISFLVVPRPNEQIPEKIPDYVSILSFDNMLESEAASTEIRNALVKGDLLDKFLPKEVENYLAEFNIYR